jgi:hypothetical protein
VSARGRHPACASDGLQSGDCRARAFSRRGSPYLGKFEDAVILKIFGDSLSRGVALSSMEIARMSY